MFVYKALAEWYTFGDTDVEAEKLHDHVTILRNPTCHNNGYSALGNITVESGLRAEFNVRDPNNQTNKQAHTRTDTHIVGSCSQITLNPVDDELVLSSLPGGL